MSDTAWHWALKSVTGKTNFPLVYPTFKNLHEFCSALIAADGHEKLTATQLEKAKITSQEFIKFLEYLTREDKKSTPQNIRRLIGLACTLLEWSHDTQYFEQPQETQNKLIKESPLQAINNIGLEL